ncbi:lipopolysaccharide biosynthesis protein [Sphingosinicella sp. BN140058]|uniref:lipopolysaccharide biosynthesis protein n=1 Tax=Sphingosinicella sp. BN140058 TaxID=1892855 RepID=UPI0013EBB329|nr:polysaccharide biosynthesis C-terminal domain-containing protein [Sphingosinicella sp. BN140058]
MTSRRRIFAKRDEYGGFAIRLAYMASAFLLSVLLARLLGPASLGRYYGALAWILIASTFAQAGWNTFLVREVHLLQADGRSGALIGLIRAAVQTASAISLLTGATVLIVGGLLLGRADLPLLVLGTPAILLLALSSVGDAVVRGCGRPLASLLGEYLARPGVQILALALIAAGMFAISPTPFAAMASFLLAAAAGSLVTYALTSSALSPHRGSRAEAPPRGAWQGSFFRTALVGCLVALNLQIGTLILSRLSPEPEVALFRIAQQLSLLLPFGLAVVSSLYATRFAEYRRADDQTALRRLAVRASLISLAIALPLALLFLLLGAPLIRLLYGSAFAAAAGPLLVMTAGQVINAGLGIGMAVAIASHREKAALWAQVAGLAVNAGACLLLIPRFHAVGAALGSSAGLAVFNVLLLVLLVRPAPRLPATS